MNPKVDFYFSKAKNWQEEINKLRILVLECGLNEELKWGCPCYTAQKNNVVLIHVFKNYCALLFFKGALLKDSKGLLTQQTENVQAARQMRFTSISEIVKKESQIKAYVFEATEIEKAGLKVVLKKNTEFKMPEEFENKLNKMPALKKAFNSLTPGRQRAYLLHFSQAKQAQTREARIQKCVPNIMIGKGLND
ncbi:MAG: YdeI/OmpD-associated family protein [Bacteroidia bacterium]|nr:YdeI/OmpD-associated family protein [Bacteroidia bacterium]